MIIENYFEEDFQLPYFLFNTDCSSDNDPNRIVSKSPLEEKIWHEIINSNHFHSQKLDIFLDESDLKSVREICFSLIGLFIEEELTKKQMENILFLLNHIEKSDMRFLYDDNTINSLASFIPSEYGEMISDLLASILETKDSLACYTYIYELVFIQHDLLPYGSLIKISSTLFREMDEKTICRINNTVVRMISSSNPKYALNGLEILINLIKNNSYNESISNLVIQKLDFLLYSEDQEILSMCLNAYIELSIPPINGLDIILQILPCAFTPLTKSIAKIFKIFSEEFALYSTKIENVLFDVVQNAPYGATSELIISLANYTSEYNEIKLMLLICEKVDCSFNIKELLEIMLMIIQKHHDDSSMAEIGTLYAEYFIGLNEITSPDLQSTIDEIQEFFGINS